MQTKKDFLDTLQEQFPDSSRTTLRSWVKNGRIQADDDGTYSLLKKRKTLPEDLLIVFEDRDLIIVDKPANLLSVATDKEQYRTAHAILKRAYPSRDILPIHRLDRETSGLLIFSCNTQAYHSLKQQLEEHTLKREYRALVHGNPGNGTWESALFEDSTLRVRVVPKAKGKWAVTHYETLSTENGRSLLKLNLETGRKHQIRVQAAHAGHPIVGDKRYGQSEGSTGLQLVAVELTFIHPRKGHTQTLRRNAIGQFG